MNTADNRISPSSSVVKLLKERLEIKGTAGSELHS